MIRKRVIAISLVVIVVLGVFLYYFAIPRISVSGTGTVSTTRIKDRFDDFKKRLIEAQESNRSSEFQERSPVFSKPNPFFVQNRYFCITLRLLPSRPHHTT